MTYPNVKIDATLKQALDQTLDAGLIRPPLTGDGKELLDLLRYLEAHWRFTIPSEVSAGLGSKRVLESRAFNAAGLALSTLAHERKASNAKIEWAAGITTLEDIHAWKSFFDNAQKYSDMCDWMHAVWNEWHNPAIHSPVHISFAYDSALSKRIEAAEWSLDSISGPLMKPATDLGYMLQQIVKAGTPNSSLLEAMPLQALSKAYEWCAIETSPRWSTGEPVGLDGFDSGDFRKFWTALFALSSIHKLAWSNAHETLLHIAVPVLTQDKLISLLVELSALPRDQVTYLLDYVTFDKKLWKKRTLSDALIQPVFKLASEKYSFSPTLILEGNSERNMFDLLNRKNNALYSDIVNLKELIWSKELEPVLRSYSLRTESQFSYANTKMDLIVLDLLNKVILCCELKWLLTPDRFKDWHVEYIADGYGQAKRARDWALAHLDAIACRFSLPQNALDGFAVHPLLLVRDTLLAGLAIDPAVPLATATLFEVMLSNTKGNLRALWTCLNDGTYLPVEGRHFVEEPATLSFNGITFDVRVLTPGPEQFDLKQTLKISCNCS